MWGQPHQNVFNMLLSVLNINVSWCFKVYICALVGINSNYSNMNGATINSNYSNMHGATIKEINKL
jgi:hypothetical protein